MLWHELRWPQLDEIDKETPVVVPLGSCEQHGHHLPVFVDSLQVSEIARRVESAMPERMLLLPTLWLGSSHHHQDFPGTVSVAPLLYAQVIQQVAQSVLRAGFRRVFFLNGHGGNRAPAADALSELVAGEDRANDAYLVLSSWWEIGHSAMHRACPDLIQTDVAHACEIETSVMLAIRGDLVATDQIVERVPALENEWFHSEDTSKSRVAVFRRFHRLTADGALGLSQEGTAEKGEAILEGVSEEVVAFLDDFVTWPSLPPRR